MKCYCIPNIFFLSLTLIAPLSAARVKQVCRRPAEALQRPQVQRTPVLYDRGITKPSQHRVRTVVIQEEKGPVFLGKRDKQCLELFVEKCSVRTDCGKVLNNKEQALLHTTLLFLAAKEKKHDFDLLSAHLEKLQRYM